MKRTLAMLLALVLILSCGAITTAMADDLPQAEVRMWVLGPGEQADAEMVKEQLNKILNENVPNTQLTLSLVDGNVYQDMFSKAMAASERVDLAWTGWMHSIATLASEGTLLPLNDLLNEYGQDIIASLGEDVVEMHRLSDGELYQVISWQGLVGNHWGVVYPTELLELMPDGWQEEMSALLYEQNANPSKETMQKLKDTFELYPQTLKEQGKLLNGLEVSSLTIFLSEQVIPGYRRNWCYVAKGDDTFKVKSIFDEEYGLAGWAEYVASMYTKGYIQMDVASATQSVQWKTELTQTDYICGYGQANDDEDIAASCMYYDMPITMMWERPECQFVMGTATGMSIPYTCKEPERAMMVLNEFFKNPELYRTFVYGIRDKHWTDNGDGTGTTLCGVGQATSDWAYGQYKWVVGSCMNSVVTQNDTVGHFAKLKELEKTAYASPLLRFAFDETPVAAEAANLLSVYKEYYEGMLAKGYLGDEWKTRYDEFKAKMDGAGLETYIAEMQRQLDEFVKANDCKW